MEGLAQKNKGETPQLHIHPATEHDVILTEDVAPMLPSADTPGAAVICNVPLEAVHSCD
jgi:hypothetical protein